MASNNYTSANIAPSSDTFREWVDLTNRITYDMEKYVVSTAPAGNTQGAETIGNAHVNGYFGANTVLVFDGIAGATGNATHYGTRSPADNLVFHTNAVFADDGTNTAIIHAQSNVHGTNSGIQFTSNTTVAAITINTTSDVFESNAGVNRFNTVMDINANVDIDNDLVTINSGNTTLGGNSTAGEFNVLSNTAFEANVFMDAELVEMSSNTVKITANTDLFQSNATLNDINSNLDIDNSLTTVTSANAIIEGGHLDITSVLDVDNSDTDITATDFTVTGTTANLDSTTTAVNGTTLDINSATVDVDSATAVNFNSPDVGINGALLDINSATVDVDSATAVNFNSPDVGINGALLDINSTTVDVDGTLLDVLSTDVNISGSNLVVDSVNVEIDGTAANLDSTTTNINGTTLDINSTTVDVDGTLLDITSTDVNVSGSNVTIDSVNVDIDGTAANLDSTTTNINGTTLDINSTTVDVDSTTVDFTATDINLSGTNTLIDSTNTNIHGKLLDVTSNVTVNAESVYIHSVNTTIGEANDDIFNVISDTKLHDKLNVVKNVDFDADLNVDGNQQLDGTLTVDDVTYLKSTANVDGLLVAKDNFHLTGTANVSVRVNVGANVHANTTAYEVGTGEGKLVASNGSLVIGNSTVFTSATMANVETTGTATVAGHTDLNSTLNVNGIGTFEDTTNSASNTTGAVIVAGGIGVAKSATVGEDVTVHGDIDIKGNVTLGDANGDDIAFLGRANTNIVPTSNANLKLGTATKTWDVHADDIRTATMTASGDVQIDGNLTVDQSANVGYPFSVSNTSTTAFQVQTRNGGDDREIIVGNTVPNTTAAEDRLIIRSAVGNSTIGLLPLHGNNVVLGDGTHRWILTANTGHFSGDVTVADTTQSSSKTTGSAKLAGGLGVTKKVFIGQDLVAEAAANIAGLLSAKNNVNIGNTTNGEANTFTLKVRDTAAITSTLAAGNTTVTGFVNATTTIESGGDVTVGGNADIAGSANVGTNLNVTSEANTSTLRVRSSSNLEGTLEVAGDLTANSDVTLGNASSDTVKFIGSIGGNSTVGIIPSANGRILGTNLKRFKAALTTVNASGDITAGADVDISGEANTDTLRVRGETSNFEQANVHFGNSTTGYANVTVAPTVADANVNYVKVDTGKLEAVDLVITGSAVLPDDTTLTATSLGTANLTVTDTTFFSGADANSTYTPSVRFGDGSDAEHAVIVNFENALVNTHFVADTTARDIGTNAKRWGEGHFNDLLQVGGSSGVVINSANVTADNIIARDDLIAASSSDRDLKTNLLKIDTAVNKVEELGGYEFEWNSNIGDERIGTKEYGVIAQEVEQILPHAVKINSRGYRTVNYNSLIPLLIEAVKELSGRVEELETKERREELDG